jgi:hypothetical protein
VHPCASMLDQFVPGKPSNVPHFCTVSPHDGRRLALAIFVWRAHPLLTVSLALVFAAVVAWMGYRVETILRPESSRLRRLATSALAVGSVGLAAYLLWISLCACA